MSALDLEATSDRGGETAGTEPETATDTGWKRDKKGREYVGARGRAGTVYRSGSETVAEALARDEAAREAGRPPKSRRQTVRKQPAPTRKTSKELEAALEDVLVSPSLLAAMRGDVWVADHICAQAPVLARNLVAAADHNPKLRARLEKIASGETGIGQAVVWIAVAQATLVYAVPVVIYYLGDHAPRRLRDTFQVPTKPVPAPGPDREESMDDLEAAAAWRTAAGPESRDAGAQAA